MPGILLCFIVYFEGSFPTDHGFYINKGGVRGGPYSADKHPEKLAELKQRLDALREALREDTDALLPSPNPDGKPGFNKW